MNATALKFRLKKADFFLHFVLALTVLGMAQMVQGELRCYCNDVTCVANGYMCKSLLRICFSQTIQNGSTSLRFYHACAELLSGTDVNVTCSGGVGLGRPSPSLSSTKVRTEVRCCSTDMCNYRDIKTIDHWSTMTNSDPGNSRLSVGGQQVAADDQSIWFQALVIAVSLIGAIFLLFLLMITVRILVVEQLPRTLPMSRSQKHCGHVIDLGAFAIDDRNEILGSQSSSCHVTLAGFCPDEREMSPMKNVELCHDCCKNCNCERTLHKNVIGDVIKDGKPEPEMRLNWGKDCSGNSEDICRKDCRMGCNGQHRLGLSGGPRVQGNIRAESFTGIKVFPLTYHCVTLTSGDVIRTDVVQSYPITARCCSVGVAQKTDEPSASNSLQRNNCIHQLPT